MVRLSKIYTKTGDDGSTGLGNGARVSKTDPRVESYGIVDEANAAIGLCVIESGRAAPASPSHAAGREGISKLLTTIQNDLFDVGADLCCPIDKTEAPGSRLRIAPAQTTRLELAIDEHNARLKPLDSFILPGGSPLAASLHLARTIVRRAERATVALAAIQPAETNPETVKYLNRLSDLLFVLARVANDDGARDVKWVPGASRDSDH
jgi:cob(I)alamin adenosyltransferase